MATKIEWTDETWNPLRARRASDGKVGNHCEMYSPGCTNCYAGRMNIRALPHNGTGLPYVHSSRAQVETFLDPSALVKPIGWKKPKRIFPCSMTDLFGEWVSYDQIDRVFAVMGLTPQHRYQVLTKRAFRMMGYCRNLPFERVRKWLNRPADGSDDPSARNLATLAHVSTVECARRHFPFGDEPHHGCPFAPAITLPLPNVELGVSAENQERYDKRIGYLVETPAARRFISAEPLIGPIVLKVPCGKCGALNGIDLVRCRKCAEPLPPLGIDWLIIGGESGPGARPCDIKWIRSLLVQCSYAGIVPYVKQLGSNCREFIDPNASGVSGRPLRLKHPKGGDWNEWPEDLRIREFPEVTRA